MLLYNMHIPTQMTKYCFKKAVLILGLLIGLVIPLMSASAADVGDLPAFSDFVIAVKDGQAQVVRGVYVPETLALRVVQQPLNDAGSVSRVDGVATQYRLAAGNQVIGLLAHNDLAGASFPNLKMGQEVRIVYGNGRVEYYLIDRLVRFQALDTGSYKERYIDLSSGVSYTPQDIFSMFYSGDVHVTFQTCIFQNGMSAWGRLFVTAIPNSFIYQSMLRAFGFGFHPVHPKVGIISPAAIRYLPYR
jgi:hypothetical protein